ncbi:MAG: YrdB family protein [Candidatus Thorarchaeota archaeon]
MSDISEKKSIGANDALRFILEVWTLVALGYWGLNQDFGLFNYALMLMLPIAAAAIWGVFAVPNDPSRSGGAPVPVPGAARLLLEFLILGSAFLAMYVTGLLYPSLIFGVLAIIHYILAHERIRWLLGPKEA